jgi:hypothetical protein
LAIQDERDLANEIVEQVALLQRKVAPVAQPQPDDTDATAGVTSGK